MLRLLLFSISRMIRNHQDSKLSPAELQRIRDQRENEQTADLIMFFIIGAGLFIFWAVSQ